MTTSTYLPPGALTCRDGTDSQCGSPHYYIETRGIPDATPQPFQAWQGVPFFPELEPDNRKYFRVQSGTDVVIFLHSSSQIINQDTDAFYQIILQQNGMVIINRSGTSVITTPAANLLQSLDYVDFYVEVNQNDFTIHVGKRNGGEIVSWQDTTLIDVNYILVQKYNDPDGNMALWQFCEGVLKLLSQNQLAEADKAVETADRNNDPTNYRDEGIAYNVIDGNTNEGLFDEEHCQILDHHTETDATLKEHNWWRVDLKDMYDIKAVTMMNGQDYLCPRNRRDWHYFGSACYFVGTTPMTWNDASADCQSYGGNLVYVTVPAVEDFLKEWLSVSTNTMNYWIGLTDAGAGTSNWYWAGYTPTVFDVYTDWAGGQPVGAGTGCIRMNGNSNFQWFEDNCGASTERYVCQVPQCDTGWVLFGTTCYYVSTTAANYADARSACQGDALRGELATINSTYINVS
ncbi:uncharacterized protein [Amphiura filiformis]|uniref:uncharacterized protein n=1 Tax=Amphiura filiformis TaxID=82378 RepID=UPI003B210A83